MNCGVSWNRQGLQLPQQESQFRVQGTELDNDLDLYHLYSKEKGDAETYSY